MRAWGNVSGLGRDGREHTVRILWGPFRTCSVRCDTCGARRPALFSRALAKDHLAEVHGADRAGGFRHGIGWAAPVMAVAVAGVVLLAALVAGHLPVR